MASFQILLFRQLSIRDANREPIFIDSQKAQELLCYLIIYHHRPHLRERLADLLWPKSSQTQSKQYLRQTLWQLQTALNKERKSVHLLTTDAEWIKISNADNIWFDIHEFEHAYTTVQGLRGHQLAEENAVVLRKAISLYRGDLLENCYQDWCIFERERLQNIYLLLLDKLAGYCEATRNYEDGIMYGSKILSREQAHERTFRRLMRLHYRAGNRTGALRLYRRCEVILKDELGVKPSELTQNLYRQIQSDDLPHEEQAVTNAIKKAKPLEPPLRPTPLKRLKFIKRILTLAQNQIEKEISTIKYNVEK